MLLYVDKKKQKRQKIKVLCFIFTSIFIVLANILHFKKVLHSAKTNLTNYQNIQIKNDWFYTSDSLQIFTKKNKQTPIIIIAPQKITRENAQLLSVALSKVPNNTTIQLSSNLKNKKTIKTLINQLNLDTAKTSSSQKTLITSDIKEVEKLIYKEKLFPKFITYKNAQKLNNTPQIKLVIDNLFPLPSKPTTTLEQELYSIKEFTNNYKKELINAFSTTPKYSFTTHGFFLKNINICAITSSKTICEINDNNSLEKNIKNILEQSTNDKQILQISLLTTLKEISPNDLLENDEGIIFQFEKRKEILLPQEIKKLSINDNPFYIIKQKLGINPNHLTPQMKFYKFKTLEININDAI